MRVNDSSDVREIEVGPLLARLCGLRLAGADASHHMSDFLRLEAVPANCSPCSGRGFKTRDFPRTEGLRCFENKLLPLFQLLLTQLYIYFGGSSFLDSDGKQVL